MPVQPVEARDPSDTELVERIRRGDPRAMRTLMRRHGSALYRTARAILRDDGEAEEAVQDAYLQAFRGLAAFRGESAVSTWLVRIAANESLMRLRRQRRRAAAIPIDHEQGDALSGNVPDDSAAGPEQSALAAEMRRMIARRIDALPRTYRAVLVMRAVQECSVEETAAALDLLPSTVRTRLFRARAMMRAAIERELDPRRR